MRKQMLRFVLVMMLSLFIGCAKNTGPRHVPKFKEGDSVTIKGINTNGLVYQVHDYHDYAEYIIQYVHPIIGVEYISFVKESSLVAKE